MDTFIDKLAQKTIANDMINVNAAAEAREKQKIDEQLAGFEGLLQEMKQVNLKNIESATKVTELIEGVDISGVQNQSAGISAEDMEELKSSLSGKAEEIVKVGEDSANIVKYAAEDAVLSVKISAEDAVNEVKASVGEITTDVQTKADTAIAAVQNSSDGAVASVKETAEEAILSVKTAADEAISSAKTATDDVVLIMKGSVDDAVASVKTAADDAVTTVKAAGEEAAESVARSTEDIKQAAEVSANEIKQITEAGVEGMKTASAESVESIKQASMDATETIKQVVEDGLEAIKGASDGVVRGNAPEMDQELLNAKFEEVEEAIHIENVKVYRNVQAAVDDSLADQTKAIRGYIERSQKDGSKLPMVLGIINFALNILIIAILILMSMGIIK